MGIKTHSNCIPRAYNLPLALMQNYALVARQLKISVLFFALLFYLAPSAFAEFTLASNERFVTLRIGLADSLQISDFSRSPAATSPETGSPASSNPAYDYFQNTIRARILLWGKIAPTISFSASAEVSTDKGNRDIWIHSYDPYLGYPYDLVGDGASESKGRTWDFFTAKTEWIPVEYLQFSAGFDYLSWGPAKRNKLILRGDDFYWRPFQDSTARITRPVPAPFAGFAIDLNFISYSQYVFSLKNWKNYDKYLHAHRLDFNFSNNFKLGLTETIIYGGSPNPNHSSNAAEENGNEERSVEAVYLIPFAPYLFAQHYVGDRDNAAMSVDFSWKFFRNFEIYGELFLDDLNSLDAFFDDSWWGNKWGTSLGLAASPQTIGAFLWDWNFEYTRIEPWVYTHHKGGGNDYSHYGQSLGSSLGPNAQEFYSRFGLSWRNIINVDFAVSAVAKDTAFGGQLTDIHKETDPTDKKFLNPSTTLHYQEYSAALKWQPLRYRECGQTRCHSNANANLDFDLYVQAKQYLIFGDFKGQRTELSSGVLW